VVAVARASVAALALFAPIANAQAILVAAAAQARSDRVSIGPLMDRAAEERVLALDPANLTPADVRDVLAQAPAPRIINLQGSAAPITMTPFAEYLIAMGYPEARLRDPRDGSMSQTSFADSEQLAGMLAWYYETEGMMPMIGHSQGGMLAIRVLYELKGEFHAAIPVWNPLTGESEPRTTIVDPLTAQERPVIGLKVPYVAALATGKLPRLLLGQWQMLGRLRAIPIRSGTLRASRSNGTDRGTSPGSERYYAMGTAQVTSSSQRNQSHRDAARSRSRRQPGDAGVDRRLPSRVAARCAAGRGRHRRVEHCPCGRHLVQRQEALVPRGTASDRRAPRRDAGQGWHRLKGKLNLFQAAMVRWREMHPYNAVHVVRVSQPLTRRGWKRLRRRLEVWD
jgi:hypothetical protein